MGIPGRHNTVNTFTGLSSMGLPQMEHRSEQTFNQPRLPAKVTADVAPKHVPGQIACDELGNVYRYMKYVSASASTALGSVVRGIAPHVIDVDAAGGTKHSIITTAATTLTIDAVGCLLHFNAGVGVLGTMRIITGCAISTPATKTTLTFSELDHIYGPGIDRDAEAYAVVVPNGADGCVVYPHIADIVGTGPVVGIALMVVPTTYWSWFQIAGYASVLFNGNAVNIAVGDPLDWVTPGRAVECALDGALNIYEPLLHVGIAQQACTTDAVLSLVKLSPQFGLL